jgi:hypothetical protein
MQLMELAILNGTYRDQAKAMIPTLTRKFRSEMLLNTLGSIYRPPNLRVVDGCEADDVEGLDVSRYVPFMIANSISCRFFKSSSPSG